MKKLLILAAAIAFGLPVSAQIYYQDANNVDMLRPKAYRNPKRQEIVLPKVNGYNIYKADLHTHTIFSDGDCTPKYRVREAWLDGLDVMAVTEHIEYRPMEKTYMQFLHAEISDKTKLEHKGIVSDLNMPVELAKKEAEKYDLTIIPGVEITRAPETIGHYNALFTTDNNTIHSEDPMESIKNARKQGALVMHNHPGWRRKSVEMPEFEKKAYGEKLIDGVEIMNGQEVLPKIVTRAKNEGLFMAANTDIHATTAQNYGMGGHYRNMTLILAPDKSLESLKEALKARRSIAYSIGSLAGDEQLLKEFFVASIKFEDLGKNTNGKSDVWMINNTSFGYYLRFGKDNVVELPAFTAQKVTTNESGELSFTVLNMWIPGEKNLEIKLKF